MSGTNKKPKAVRLVSTPTQMLPEDLKRYKEQFEGYWQSISPQLQAVFDEDRRTEIIDNKDDNNEQTTR